MSRRLFLLDGNALLHRAWHALPPLTSPKGVVVNALYGVLMAVIKVIERESPDAFIACWDVEGGTFRHEVFESYKAQREKKDEALYAQIPMVQEGLALMGIPSCSASGFEADDVIGTLAHRAEKEGWQVVILTGDRDLLQLITKNIVVRLFRKGISDTEEVTETTIKSFFGVTPEQVIDYKILRGDASDNIPGIKGIGEKGAKELLERYGNIDGIMRAVHDTASIMTNRQRIALQEGEQDLSRLRSLVTIRTDVPLDVVIAQTHIRREDELFLAFLREQGFKSLISGESSPKKSSKQTAKKAPSTPVGDEDHERIKLHPMMADASSAKEIVDWIDAHVGDIACIFTSGGGMVPADVWLCATNQQVLHILDRAWIERNTWLNKIRERGADLVVHDAKQMLYAFAKEGVMLESVGMDTQIAAYLLEANSPEQSLEELSSRYADTEALVGGAAVAFLHEVAPILRKQMVDVGLWDVYERLERPLIRILYSMEVAGVRIDQPYLAKLFVDFSKEQRHLERQMEMMAGQAFNPASPLQLGRVLFEKLNLPKEGIKRGKNGYSTSADTLEKLRGTHPIIEAVEQYREVSKLLSTYIQPLPSLADGRGRVHTTFHQAVTSTGRLSSTDPNLQNIPIRSELGRKIRKAFIAEEGKLLLSCDYAQIDLRVAAALAKDEALLQAFARNEDIHRSTAAAMWQIAPGEVTIEQRRAAKAVNFGVLYGQGAFGLSEAAGVSFSEAKDFIHRYFSAYHRLQAYLEEIKETAKERGYVETYFGRRRPIPELFSPVPAIRAGGERMAMNMPIQGTTADILKLAMIAVSEQMPHWSSSARMLLQVHDELIFEIDTEEASMLATRIQECMEAVVDIGVPLRVEAKTGTNWEEMDKIDR